MIIVCTSLSVKFCHCACFWKFFRNRQLSWRPARRYMCLNPIF